MGSMSASDAAPLPRLGEVYFDVRGESRSMRLSWYADTGVAVFSIWQGGTCTGTFRLPIADLPRMIEALQRGPSAPDQEDRAVRDAGHASGQYGPGDYGSGGYGRTERYDAPGRDLGPEPDTGYSDPGFPAAAASNPEGYRRTGAHGRHEETRAVYPDEGHPGGAGGYRAEHGGSYADEPPTGVYRGDGLGQDSGGYGDDPLSAGYRAAPHDDPLDGGYGDDSLPGGYRDEPHGGPYRADSLPGGYRADLPGGHHDDPPPASYTGEPRGGGRRADRHGGDYQDDPLTGAYPDERGYADEPMTARYGAEAPTGDYPAGPSDPDVDDPDYPAPPGNAGYSPARPYVAPPPRGPRRTGEGRGGRRRGG